MSSGQVRDENPKTSFNQRRISMNDAEHARAHHRHGRVRSLSTCPRSLVFAVTSVCSGFDAARLQLRRGCFVFMPKQIRRHILHRCKHARASSPTRLCPYAVFSTQPASALTRPCSVLSYVAWLLASFLILYTCLSLLLPRSGCSSRLSKASLLAPRKASSHLARN